MTTTLIHTGGRVLAAIDTSVYADSVARHAGWAASRLGAPLELLHAIDKAADTTSRDLSGNLALGTRERLLDELATLDEQRARRAQQDGRELLDGLRARLQHDSGVQAEVRQRHGHIVDTLLELEGGVRLFVIGKRGEHADFAKGHLGSNLERVVRAVHRPVLVAARAFRPIGRFLIAFDGSATTRRAVEMVCASPLLEGAHCYLLMVGQDDAERIRQLEWAIGQLQQTGFTPHAKIIYGNVEKVIAQHVEEHAVDLLVMGAYGHSRIRSMILGSTTTQLLRTCRVSVLLLR